MTDVYLMAALLSATAEKNRFCLGFEYEFVVSRFEFGESRKIKKYSWPSSIAVLDLQLQTRHNTPSWNRLPFMESVKTGERWCEYYHNIFGVDVRSIVIPV
jgi:hypothetical protein